MFFDISITKLWHHPSSVNLTLKLYLAFKKYQIGKKLRGLIEKRSKRTTLYYDKRERKREKKIERVENSQQIDSCGPLL